MKQNEIQFYEVLEEGERLVGEWVAQAHGTRYKFPSHPAPWFVFDLMKGQKRALLHELEERIGGRFSTPQVISYGLPAGVDDMMARLGKGISFYGHHKALDPVEGAVWRVERKGQVDFLAKYVRPDKVDGHYLPEISGDEAIWNWATP